MLPNFTFVLQEIAENEDGCQFSKDLARCLQIEIKGETY